MTDDDVEIHTLNPEARRRSGGYWNEDVLPVMDWEAPEYRVVIPVSLHRSLKPISSVLRWDLEKFSAVMAKHPRDAEVALRLDRYLAAWKYHGVEKGSRNQRVLIRDDAGRWYAVSLGPLLGSDNMITIIGSRRASFVRNRLLGLEDVVECIK